MTEHFHRLTQGQANAVRDIVQELARMDADGLPRDGSMATAAGSLSVRAVNRARWLVQTAADFTAEKATQ